MTKRKRKEQFEVPATTENGTKKKRRFQKPAGKAINSEQLASSKQKSAVVPAPVPESTKPTAVRIVVGSYEKVLAGIDARFTSEAAGNVISSLLSLIRRIKCC
jgi:hypothetical protein